MSSALDEARQSLILWIGLVLPLLLLPAMPSRAADCGATLGEIRAIEAEAIAMMGDRAGASRQRAAALKQRLAGARERLEACRTVPAASKQSGRGEDAGDARVERGRGDPKARLDPAASDQKVLDEYGSDIPESAREPSAADVTVIQDDELFRRDLQKLYPQIGDDQARRINGYAYGYGYGRKILVNAATANEATPIHEALHHYAHEDFKNAFRRVSGVKVNEGVTEYFTRKLTQVDRTGIYDVEIGWAKGIARAVGERTLRKAYFQGDRRAIEETAFILAVSLGGLPLTDLSTDRDRGLHEPSGWNGPHARWGSAAGRTI